jgi:hypothetical protein
VFGCLSFQVGVRQGIFGVLVFWCFGVLVFWCFGVLVFWCFGVLVFWCYPSPEVSTKVYLFLDKPKNIFHQFYKPLRTN